MKRALVIHHSLFGNTKDIAHSLAKGLMNAGIETDCLHIDEVDLNEIPNFHFLAIGGPTHMIGLSKPMKAFLQNLSAVPLQKVAGFAFDTRNESKMNSKKLLILENSAAKRIEGRMKKLKMRMVYPRQSALVHGREGPLEDQMLEKFQLIGEEIAQLI